MNLLEGLRVQCAAALDSVCDIVPDGVPFEISIVVSHPGRAGEDALVIGTHELGDLVQVIVGVEQATIAVGTVTQDGYVEHDGLHAPKTVQ